MVINGIGIGICFGNIDVITITDTESSEPEPKKYLTIEALEDDLTASLSMNACEYCIDGDGNWKTLSVDTPTESINAGQTLSFRGNLEPAANFESGILGIGIFTISKKCNILGNATSMLFGDDAQNNFSLSGKDWAFSGLFAGCTNIISAKDLYLPATTATEGCYFCMFSGCTSLTTAPAILPATTLAEECYWSMFNGCTSLTTAPELPATTLAECCYKDMFRGCTSLETAPELPATTLVYDCYNSMFYGCTSLTTAPVLPATTLADYCYYSMFSGCTSLTTAPELPATVLAECCYSGMFAECVSLTTAPVLPATTLTMGCYEYMFEGCTSLNHIKMLATDISAESCLNNWVYDVASAGTFIKHPDMTSLSTGADGNGIPEGWTVEIATE